MNSNLVRAPRFRQQLYQGGAVGMAADDAWRYASCWDVGDSGGGGGWMGMEGDGGMGGGGGMGGWGDGGALVSGR